LLQTPIGPWPKDERLNEIGRFSQMVLDQDAEGYILFIANTLGWTREEILVYLAMLRREIRSAKHHAYYLQRVVWARKPENDS
jgi:hypothetical protein